MKTWQALYDSPTQGLWALVVLPILFLGWLAVRGHSSNAGVEPVAAGFVRRWAVIFAAIALIEPVTFAAVALIDRVAGWQLRIPLVPFVLLGDFRVFALVLVVMQPTRSRRAVLLEAAAWTAIVPAFAYGTIKLVERVAIPQPTTMLWLVYEVGFIVLADLLVAWLIPRRVASDREPVRRYVRAVLGFVVFYYALWALADVLILSGQDRGWALRMLPNQLYYGLLVPFAYARFFSAHAASSTSTQAST